MIARLVGLEDWFKVEAMWDKFDHSPQAFTNQNGDRKVVGNKAQLKTMFLASLTSDAFKMFGLFSALECHTIMICQEIITTEVNEEGLFFLRRHCFIRAVFSLSGTNWKHNCLVDDVVVEWAKSKGHVYISGNCRVGIPQNALKRYGYTPQHISMGKRID